MATKTRRAGARKAAKRGTKSMLAKRSATRRSGAKKSSRAMSASRSAKVARVKRVAREVVQQATVAVTAGVETLKDLGGNLIDRVRA